MSLQEVGSPATTEICVARQAIFNRAQELFGYELMFRGNLEGDARPEDQDQAAFELLHTALLGFGLDPLLGDRVGFLRASSQVLREEFYRVIPRERAIIELLETVEPSAEALESCRTLKQAGYRLALDDFVRRPAHAPFAELADIIKVDLAGTTEAERRALVREFGPRKVQLLAERVDSRAELASATAEGFHLFQGTFFCEPELVRGSDVPAYKRNCVRFMTELHRPELDFDRLEVIIRQEISLAVKLLRYLNSAGFGWRHEVTSIKHALRVLGERAARKWCALVALTVLGSDKPTELVVTSLVRAQFLEQLGHASGIGGRDMDLFLVGLLSTLDALLGQPMDVALAQIPLSNEIRDTLLGRRTTLSPLWALAVAYERGQWDQIKELAEQADVSVGRLPGLYRGAVQWVDRIFRG